MAGGEDSITEGRMVSPSFRPPAVAATADWDPASKLVRGTLRRLLDHFLPWPCHGHLQTELCGAKSISPSYAELGKAVRHIFNKGFGFRLVKLDVKIKLCSDVELSTSGSFNTDTGKITGNLETKYKCCEYAHSGKRNHN